MTLSVAVATNWRSKPPLAEGAALFFRTGHLAWAPITVGSIDAILVSNIGTYLYWIKTVISLNQDFFDGIGFNTASCNRGALTDTQVISLGGSWGKCNRSTKNVKARRSCICSFEKKLKRCILGFFYKHGCMTAHLADLKCLMVFTYHQTLSRPTLPIFFWCIFLILTIKFLIGQYIRQYYLKRFTFLLIDKQ